MAELALRRVFRQTLRRSRPVGLTVHDGHVVEIQKVENIRKIFTGGKE